MMKTIDMDKVKGPPFPEIKRTCLNNYRYKLAFLHILNSYT